MAEAEAVYSLVLSASKLVMLSLTEGHACRDTFQHDPSQLVNFGAVAC